MDHKDLKKTKEIVSSTLPSAAQRWLNHVLPENITVPTQIIIKQEGEMEIRGRWTAFTAEGNYQGAPLSFSWKARLRMVPGVWIVAEDGHSDGSGWGGAKLWGVVPMGQRTDPEVLTVQLIRNISELAWLPELALLDPELGWSDAGEDAFEISCQAGEQEVVVQFTVNNQGDIVSAYSPSRPYDIPDGYAESPWHYKFDDHREFDGIRIPSRAVATYERSDGSWEYFRGQVTSVEREEDHF